MKKLMTLLLALTLLLTACGTAPENTDPSGTTAPQPTQPETRTLWVRSSSTTQTGDITTRTDYVFDEDDRVCQVRVYTGPAMTHRYQVTCDDHGNYVLWESDGARIEYGYSEHGELLGYYAYTGDTLVSATEYTVEGGLRTSITQKMPGQNMEHRTTLTYDDHGVLTRQDSYLNGTLLDYSIYTLEEGKPSAMSTYLADGTLARTVTYRYEGETVTMTSDDGSRTEQVFDGHGNLLSQTDYAPDGTVSTQQTNTWKEIQVPVDSLRASL